MHPPHLSALDLDSSRIGSSHAIEPLWQSLVLKLCLKLENAPAALYAVSDLAALDVVRELVLIRQNGRNGRDRRSGRGLVVVEAIGRRDRWVWCTCAGSDTIHDAVGSIGDALGYLADLVGEAVQGTNEEIFGKIDRKSVV